MINSRKYSSASLKLVFSSIPVFHEFDDPDNEQRTEDEDTEPKDAIFTQQQLEGIFSKFKISVK